MEKRLLNVEAALAALGAYTVSGTQIVRVLADNSLAARWDFVPDTEHGATLIWTLQMGPIRTPAWIQVWGATIEECVAKAERRLDELVQLAAEQPKPKRKRRVHKPTKLGRTRVPAV